MRKLILAAVSLLAFIPATAALAAPWSKAFVIDFFEPAMYYGSNDGGDSAMGTDCPLGSMPDNDWRKMLRTSWRTDDNVSTIMNPEGPSRQRDGGFRGASPDISVYAQPWTMPDPGTFEVTGAISYGFNLDNNVNTGGFRTEDSRVTGVDNAYYRAIGCFMSWRGATKIGHHALYVMEGMRNGSFAMVMVVSGEGDDPANDPNVQVGFYMAQDKMVKDAMGEVAGGYTFRVNPAGLQSIIPARTVGGVIETRAPAFINVRSVDNVPMRIEQGQIRFTINSKGDLEGFIGGYRSVQDMYQELAGGGATFELTMRMNTVAVWYSLRRNADYKPVDGENTMISMAYRYYGKPAHVVMPDAGSAVTVARLIPAPGGAAPAAPGRGARGAAPATPATPAAPAASAAPAGTPVASLTSAVRPD